MKLAIILVTILTNLLVGCSTKNTDPAAIGDELIWVSDSSKPNWIVEVPEREGGLYKFKGQSYYHATERSSLDTAYANAVSNAIRLARVSAKNHLELKTKSGTLENAIQNAYVTIDSGERIESVGAVRNIRIIDNYTEQWSDGKGVKFRSYVLIGIGQQEYEQLVNTE